MAEPVANEPTDLIDAICTLAEGRAVLLTAPSLAARFGEHGERLVEIGLLEMGPPSAVVACVACHDDHQAPVEYDPDSRRAYHTCAEAGRVDLDDVTLTTWRYIPSWLPDQLHRLLPIRPKRRIKTIVPDAAWLLGPTAVGPMEVAAALVCGRLDPDEQEVLAIALERERPAVLGVIIAAGDAISPRLAASFGYHVVDLHEVLRLEEGELDIDRLRFAAWVGGLHGVRRPLRSGPGRPSMRDRVMEMYDLRCAAGSALAGLREEARAVQAELACRYPTERKPAIKTIEAHLRTRRTT